MTEDNSSEDNETLTEEDIEEKVSNFLRRNFPQIQMHGGSAMIQNVDLEKNSVTIVLGGACSGCGISPMTVQALKRRLPKEIDFIDEVHTSTGVSEADATGFGAGVNDPTPTKRDEETPDAPF